MPTALEQLAAAGVDDALFAAVMGKPDVDAWVAEQAAQCYFSDWLAAVSPKWHWEWPHLKLMQGYLERVARREITRVIFLTQPQVGKTQQNTVRFPAWLFERDPEERQAVGCYDQKHAKRISRQMRRICRKRRVPLSKERQAVEEWETRAGGFLRAVGVGTGITGTPVDRLHIDDPVKGFEEANSAAYRDRLWGWFTEDVMTRLQKDATVCVTMTPWHDDDLVGRILNSPMAKRWVVVRMPAEAEEDDPLGRQPGELLCPERFDRDAIEERKEALGLGYYGLYQCRPVPRGGAMFKKEWFDQSWVFPQYLPVMTQVVRYWDLANSLKGDWTVGVLMGKCAAGLFYVLDVVRGRWLAPERDRVIQDTAAADGDGVPVAFGQDPGQAGKDQVRGLVLKVAGHRAEGFRESGDKATRASGFSSQLGAGNVRVVKAPWADDYEKEFLSFPGGKHDDQVDASSGAFHRLLTARSVYEDRDLLLI